MFQTKINISIFLTGVERIDEWFQFNKLIDIVKIDFGVKEIISCIYGGTFRDCSIRTQMTIP